MTMTGKRPQPGWYALAAVLVSSLLISISAIVISVRTTAARIEQDRAARIALQQAQEQQRAALCAVVVNFDENYRSAPPTTRAGIANAASIRELRTALGCPPHQD
jgi:hypothetical protein